MTGCSHLQVREEGIVHPLENLPAYGNRQRVDLHWVRADKLETIFISTIEAFEVYSENLGWAAETNSGGRIERFSEGQIFVYYLGKMIFTPQELIYDYVSFVDVCEGDDGRDRLHFQLLRGGTANADIDDRLFLYYDESSKDFEYEIIENRYLLGGCSLEKGIERREQAEEERQILQALFDQLRPSEDETFIGEYTGSDKPLPTKSFSKTDIEGLFSQVRAFIPEEVEVVADSNNEEEYVETFSPVIGVDDVAENNFWRIVAVIYEEIWESWGVLLAEDKLTGEWTAFYNIPTGGSKVNLYLSDDIELVGDSVRGSFCQNCYGWGDSESFEIALNGFTVQKTHGYRFIDYPVDAVYDGSIAALDRQSHEAARVFRTRISEQLADGVNFAGHYSVTEVGCGTECQILVVTDVITGKVVGELTARAGAEYQLDSRLMILDSAPFCVAEGLCDPTFYELESGNLVELRD